MCVQEAQEASLESLYCYSEGEVEGLASEIAALQQASEAHRAAMERCGRAGPGGGPGGGRRLCMLLIPAGGPSLPPWPSLVLSGAWGRQAEAEVAAMLQLG